MKKNFMAIASLLIAAMLLVVSCAPEAKVENNDVANDLVDVKLSVAFGKAVVLGTTGNARIQYKYKLTPKWSGLTEGKEPYCEKTGEVVVEGTDENNTTTEYFKITSSPNISSLGRVTPGLWQVDVKGYLCKPQEQGGSYTVTDIVVLEGSTTKYFGNGNDTVTVLVAPQSSTQEAAKGTISIELEMQDLEKEGDVLQYKLQYKLDNGNYTDFDEKTSISGKAASRYKSTISATTGYHTISFKITNLKGGVTRSFYLLKGNDITITGSVTPSEFAEESAKISVLQLAEGGIELSGTAGTTLPTVETSYQPGTIATAKATFGNLPVVGGNISSVIPEYTWYWGPIDEVTSSIITSTSNNTATIELPSTPGRYTLSCKVSCAVTIKNDDGTTSEHTIYGDAALQEFLVD